MFSLIRPEAEGTDDPNSAHPRRNATILASGDNARPSSCRNCIELLALTIGNLAMRKANFAVGLSPTVMRPRRLWPTGHLQQSYQ